MTTIDLLSAISVQPGALLATAPAEASIGQLNAALAPYGLCLPVFPLVAGLTLTQLVAHNAGGRRMLRYGPIGRHLRAGVLEGVDGAAPLVIGGPTLKRATGYALNRAIAGGALNLGAPREFTFSLRPLPAAQAATLLRCASLAAACALAAELLAAGLALSALAIAEDELGAGMILAELEGARAVVERQSAELSRAAALAGASSDPDVAEPWARWERLAAAHTTPGAYALSLTLPRAALPALTSRAAAAARRYRLPLTCWGDGGVGSLHLSVRAPGREAEAAQLLAVIAALGFEVGGSVSTEFGLRDTVTGLYDTVTGRHGDRVTPNGTSIVISGAHDFHGPPIFADRCHPVTLSSGHPVAPPPGHPVTRSSGHPLPALHILDELRAIVGADFLLTRSEDLSTYETDASIAPPLGDALAVALPASTAEVAALVRVAAAHDVPVVTRGAGSGLAGGATPSAGALLISLNRIEQIVVDRAQMTMRVGAGAVTAEVQRAAEAVGLFYPPDPSSQAASTIGGNLACNAGGPRCVKYGVTADYLLAVTAVLADGSVVRWGDGLAGQAPDSGLAQLLVGSEGTLGVITEATLRLIPLPRARRTSMALFDRLEDACATVEQIMAAGIVPAALELMDDACIVAVEAYLQLGLPQDAGAMLLMLADGEPEEVEADAARLAELARAGGARSVQLASSPADEANLWKARRAVSIALARVRPNRLGEDISVPLTQIAACVRRIKQISVEHGLPIVVFGHAGDGNLHPNILFDARDPAEAARIWPAAEAIFAAALELGGTLSGEHGIGTLKRPFMRQALGDTAIAAQRRIKAQLDPAGLLNPGKLFPE